MILLTLRTFVLEINFPAFCIGFSQLLHYKYLKFWSNRKIVNYKNVEHGQFFFSNIFSFGLSWIFFFSIFKTKYIPDMWFFVDFIASFAHGALHVTSCRRSAPVPSLCQSTCSCTWISTWAHKLISESESIAHAVAHE